MKTKLFLEKRLIMADGAAGSSTPENAPPPPSVLTQNNTTTEVNTTGQEQTPGQQVAPQQPQGSPVPAPEAMQTMPQMTANPEAIKPVTSKDFDDANTATQKKGESRIHANEGIVKGYGEITVAPFTPKA